MQNPENTEKGHQILMYASHLSRFSLSVGTYYIVAGR
jgi:hypothetical protein